MDERRVHPMLAAARDLRRRQTRSEAMLWERLRARRFDGLKFRRQHPLGPFVLDFYCEERRLAVEVDGGVHDSAGARSQDRQRAALIEAEGLRLVRVPAQLVESDADAALVVIRSALIPIPSPTSRARGARSDGSVTQNPSPRPRGEGQG